LGAGAVARRVQKENARKRYQREKDRGDGQPGTGESIVGGKWAERETKDTVGGATSVCAKHIFWVQKEGDQTGELKCEEKGPNHYPRRFSKGPKGQEERGSHSIGKAMQEGKNEEAKSAKKKLSKWKRASVQGGRRKRKRGGGIVKRRPSQGKRGLFSKGGWRGEGPGEWKGNTWCRSNPQEVGIVGRKQERKSGPEGRNRESKAGV